MTCIESSAFVAGLYNNHGIAQSYDNFITVHRSVRPPYRVGWEVANDQNSVPVPDFFNGFFDTEVIDSLSQNYDRLSPIGQCGRVRRHA